MTTAKMVKLRISPLPSPSDDLVPARGFYQLEEDALYVQVGRFESGGRFFSSLESEQVRLDCDQAGRLIFIELTIPRRRWREESDFTFPDPSERADIRFLDFRTNITEPRILCDKTKSMVCLRFADEVTKSVRMGEHLVFDIGENDRLAAIWISSIVDDMAGREIAAYRRTLTSSKKNQ